MLGADGFPTGAKRFFSVNEADPREVVPVELPEGKNAQGEAKSADYPDA